MYSLDLMLAVIVLSGYQLGVHIYASVLPDNNEKKN